MQVRTMEQMEVKQSIREVIHLNIKTIKFKDMEKSGTYFGLGGIRFYDKSNILIPIVFSVKNELTVNNFTVTGSNITGSVNTANSYGTHYFIDSPFDSTKPQDGSYSSKGYWLSSSASEISITFDTTVESLFRIEYNPKPDSHTDRDLNSLTIEITDGLDNIIFNEIVGTSSFSNNTVHSIEIIPPSTDKILLLTETNSVKSIDTNNAIIDVPDQTEQSFLDYGMDESVLEEEKLNKLLELGDSVDILYYTDVPDKLDAELEITANYSPLDELGDFEVVTWTEDIDRVKNLELSAIPYPQFITKTTPTTIHGYLQNISLSEIGVRTDVGNYRILLSPDSINWKTWDGSTFSNVDTNDINIIKAQGLTLDNLTLITTAQWEQWTDKQIYIGVLVDEEFANSSVVDSINITDLAPIETTKISDTKLYILNTTSTINVTFAGSTVSGFINDADATKVQYRVILNGEKYYPTDGTFTELQPSPLNIDVTFPNSDILIDQNNTVRIEFQDYWGSTDFWETNFIGTYSGLMFIDPTGEYYSTDIGEIIKYLDFGVITAGQTTLEQKITLRNTYGYPVNNIKIRANSEDFPIGMKAQFGLSDMTFEALDEIVIDGELAVNEEKNFYVRLTTQLGLTPNAEGSFDIIVTADRVYSDTEEVVV